MARRKWTKERVIEAIRAWHKSGRRLSKVWREDPPLYAAASVHLGGWCKALEAAGFPCTERRWSPEGVTKAIREPEPPRKWSNEIVDHALAGTWLEDPDPSRNVLIDEDGFLRVIEDKRLLLIDSTGFAEAYPRRQYRLSFSEAEQQADTLVSSSTIRFALDVRKAWESGVLVLPSVTGLPAASALKDPPLTKPKGPLPPIRQSLQHVDPRLLFHAMKDTFSLEELRQLCFELGVDFDDLPGNALSAKIVSLIKRQRSRGIYETLVGKVLALRPNLKPRILGCD